MNLGEIKQAVKRQFGDESGAQITNADILLWANQALIDIVRKVDLVSQQHRETNVVTDDGSYELPENFMRMERVTYNNRLLPERELRDLDLHNNAVDKQTTGEPQSYYVWAQVLYLYPAPNDAGSGNLDIWYVSRPTALVDDNDIPGIPVHMHEDIIRYCLARAKELDEDDRAAVQAMGDYESRILQSRFETTSQPVDSYPAVRDIDNDGMYWSQGGFY